MTPVSAFGLYGLGEYQFARRWYVGARFDRSGASARPDSKDNGGSVFLTFWPTEFSQIRDQYRRIELRRGRQRERIPVPVQFLDRRARRARVLRKRRGRQSCIDDNFSQPFSALSLLSGVAAPPRAPRARRHHDRGSRRARARGRRRQGRGRSRWRRAIRIRTSSSPSRASSWPSAAPICSSPSAASSRSAGCRRSSRAAATPRSSPARRATSTRRSNVKILEIPTGQITRAMGDVHPQGNPHYWLDPGQRPADRAGDPRQAQRSSRRPSAPYFDQRYDGLRQAARRRREALGRDDGAVQGHEDRDVPSLLAELHGAVRPRSSWATSSRSPAFRRRRRTRSS